MSESKDLSLLTKSLEKLGMTLNQRQKEQFQRYMTLLLEWNEKVNLTAIIQPVEVEVKHFYDSLLLAVNPRWQGRGRVADLGTGAGFPGIPLKIFFPEIQLTLLDSSSKKVAFLELLCQELGLPQVRILHMRAEDGGRDKILRGQFDWVVSRALAPMPVLAEYCLPLVQIGGFLAAYKGPDWPKELVQAERSLQLLGGSYLETMELQLPESLGQRNILFFEKTKATPPAYPRKAGTPAKKPL